MFSPNLWSEYPWHSRGWEPAVYQAMVVFDPVVEESEDVFPVAVSCQDGEAVGVSFRPFHQRLVLVADGHSCGGLWNVDELMLQVAVIAKCEVLVVEHCDVPCFFLLAVMACDLDI